MSLSFIKALYCDKPNSDAQIISETTADSMILPVGKYLGASLEKGSVPYPHNFCFKFFYVLRLQHIENKSVRQSHASSRNLEAIVM